MITLYTKILTFNNKQVLDNRATALINIHRRLDVIRIWINYIIKLLIYKQQFYREVNKFVRRWPIYYISNSY